jgi:hypothetical protein
MSWSWAYEADLVDLYDHCKSVRVLTEYGLASRGDADFANPGQHGVYYAPNKLLGAGNVVLSTYLLDSEPDGTITHVDGPSGHIMENLSVLKRIFNKSAGLVTLRRSAPHIGGQELFVELIDQPQEGQDRFEVIWTLKSPKPLWRSEVNINTPAMASGNFNPGGDAPVDDMLFTFTGPGEVECTTTGTGFEVTGSCVVDCATSEVTGDADDPAPGLIHPKNERWFHLEGGVINALVVTGTVAMTHYPKWA